MHVGGVSLCRCVCGGEFTEVMCGKHGVGVWVAEMTRRLDFCTQNDALCIEIIIK